MWHSPCMERASPGPWWCPALLSVVYRGGTNGKRWHKDRKVCILGALQLQGESTPEALRNETVTQFRAS
jgi:hypothetical protein